MDLMKVVEKAFSQDKDYPKFNSGDTITVHYKIKEGNKERIQQYKGTVIQKKGEGATRTFTVRKMSGSVGVERIFPINSPFFCVFYYFPLFKFLFRKRETHAKLFENLQGCKAPFFWE